MGSDDVALHWRLPAGSSSSSSSGMVVVREGDCDGRVCVDENVLTVRYLHPGDSGRYTCVAKNKYGQDQRQVALKVEVSEEGRSERAEEELLNAVYLLQSAAAPPFSSFPSCSRFTALCAPRTVVQRLETGARESVAIFHLSLRREVSTEQRTRGCVRLSVWRKFSLNCYGSPPSPFSHLILDPSLSLYLFPCEGGGKRAKSQFKTSAVRSLSSRSFVRSTVPALLFPPPPHLFLLIVLISLSPSFQGPFSVNESGGGAHTDPLSPPRLSLPCLLEESTRY